mmetsp:Transcript_33565/g.77437  ORF Transcript_33565/g.77437 Transcript_33565/m.77437 type:complete len:256 (+) Transcript_33565:83-850(+)
MAPDDAEALLQKELEQIDTRLASLLAPAARSSARQSFSPPSRKPASRTATEPGPAPQKVSTKAKVAPKGKTPWVPTAPKVVERKPEPKQESLAESLAQSRARWQRISKAETPQPKPKAEPRKKDAKPVPVREPAASARASNAQRSVERVSQASSESPAPIGAYVGPEHTVSVSLDAAAPDLLEVEFSKVLFSVQGLSYLPPAIELPPTDMVIRKLSAVAERVVPLPVPNEAPLKSPDDTKTRPAIPRSLLDVSQS